MAGLFDNIRKDEWRRLLPLTLAYALVMASVYVLKPVRNALFLNRLGIDQLPYVLLLVALVGGVTATVYSRFSRAVRIDRLILGTYAFLISNLVLFRLILPHGQGWQFYLFYVWVNLYGLMSVSLLWLLANAAFNPREARRLFGFIGTGGIAGAILGGVFTGWAVDRLGTENLLIVCVGLLGVCAGLIRLVRPIDVSSDRGSKEDKSALVSVARSDLLCYLAMMAGIVAAVAAVADVQFNQIADAAFPAKDAKTAFFGAFFAYLNGFAFLFQLLLTPRILRSYGVGVALLFLPVCLAAGSLGVLLIPGLLGGVAVKVGDIGFRHSIHKSAVEILFLPVPANLKQRTKVFLDTTVDNLATGLGAAMVLVLTGPLGVSYRHLSLLSLALIAVWIRLLFRVRRAYVDTFRQALERREIDLNEFRASISEAAVINALRTALASRNKRQVIYALNVLISARVERLAESVKPLLAHPSAEVRRTAVLTLHDGADPALAPQMQDLLQDDDPDVRAAAMHFLCRHGNGDRHQMMKNYVSHPDARIRAAALGCIAEYGSSEEKALIDDAVILQVLETEGEDAVLSRMQAARVLGVTEDPDLRKYLRALMDDASPEVVRQAIRSVGRIGNSEDIPWLLDKLTDRTYRVAARHAIASFGAPALPVLTRHLADENGGPLLCRHIPRVLSQIHTQQSVDALLYQLGQAPPALRYHRIKALSKLRDRAPGLVFDAHQVDAVRVQEIRSYYERLQIRHIFQGVRENSAVRLLKKALSEKQRQGLERIFRLLGLFYPPRDMYSAYLGMVSARKAVRASAVEFLDNVLDRERKDDLLPFLDPASPEAALQEGQAMFNRPFRTKEEALTFLIEGQDIWLRACAMNCVDSADSPALVRLVTTCREDPNPLISETARMVLKRLTTDNGQRTTDPR